MAYADSIQPPKTLTQAEQALLLRVTGQRADGFRDHVLIAVGLGTALREHEVLALDVGDVFDEAGKACRRVRLRVFKRSNDDASMQEVFLPDALRLFNGMVANDAFASFRSKALRKPTEMPACFATAAMLNAIIRFSLHHRLLVVAATLLLLGYGGWQLYHLPIDVFPDLNRPRVTIMTEVDHDVRVDVGDLRVSVSITLQAALIDQAAGRIPRRILENRADARFGWLGAPTMLGVCIHPPDAHIWIFLE